MLVTELWRPRAPGAQNFLDLAGQRHQYARGAHAHRRARGVIPASVEHSPADLVVDEPVERVVDDDDRAEVFVDESVEPESMQWGDEP